MVKAEQRQLTTKFEIREQEDDTDAMPVITGYALKFNKQSQPLAMGKGKRFIETIDPVALRDANMDNVNALINHDKNQVLGRTGVNLKLSVDDIGLRFEVTPTNTTYARDLIENLRAGVISQCSFAFTVPAEKSAQTWTRSEQEGVDYERNIRAIDNLYDVSVVLNPAYQDTNANVGARSLEMVEELDASPLDDERTNILRHIDLLEIQRSLQWPLFSYT